MARTVDVAAAGVVPSFPHRLPRQFVPTPRYRDGYVAIAVMLLEMPSLLRDILATSWADEPAIRVVDGDAATPSEPPATAGETESDVVEGTRADEALTDVIVERLDAVRPEVLVVGLPEDDALRLCAAALSRFPAIKVFALEELGRSVSLYELRPTRSRLGTLSPAELADAIRHAVAPMPLAPHASVVVGRSSGGG